MRIMAKKIQTAESLDVLIKSEAVNLFSVYAFSFQSFITGGSTVGVFTLEGSNYPGENDSGQATSPPPDAFWSAVTNSSQEIAGTDSNMLYDVTQVGYRWVRLVYTPTSGAGAVVTTFVTTKGA